MKRLITTIAVLTMLVVPALVPNVTISQVNQNAPAEMTQDNAQTITSQQFEFAGYQMEISQGGEAHAWNLLYELCKLGVPGACDIYEHGQSEGWWQ